MTAYLKIENPGVADPTAFTLLGASTSRNESSTATIGKFGSGNKHGVVVCLRNKLNPVIFAGHLQMTFGTTPVVINNGINSTEFARVNVKYSGKDRHGKSRTSTEDLGFVLEYGASDWISVDLALREFVSNAIDRAILEGEYVFNINWQKENNITNENRNDEKVRELFYAALNEYRKTARDFLAVNVEVVNEGQVRAKRGFTRVFVPINEEVFRFYDNLGKWFLHFSEPELLGSVILPKGNRNLTNRKAAVVYRRGVRVREFETSDIPSLFDYNLDDLDMDESRRVDDWRIRHAAGMAMQDASKEQLAILLQSFIGTTKYWEHTFDSYGLESNIYGDTTEKIMARQTRWTEAFAAVAGDEAVLSTAEGGEFAARKGYKVIKAPEVYVRVAAKQGIKTPEKVLTQDDREGREVIDATKDASVAVNLIWGLIEKLGLTNGKSCPEVKSFRKIMSGGTQVLGFYRNEIVYINTDIAGDSGDAKSFTQQLLATVLEEISHHVTGATDNSRDFQDYVLNLAAKLMSNIILK
jgi:hypothetical protein